jgi:hypothetical protein
VQQSPLCYSAPVNLLLRLLLLLVKEVTCHLVHHDCTLLELTVSVLLSLRCVTYHTVFKCV